MVVVGRLVGTLVPARVMVSRAQTANASASTKTTAPNKPAGQSSGTNTSGSSQSSTNPVTTASAQASGGRTSTWAVDAFSLICGNSRSRRDVEFPSASTTEMRHAEI